MVILLRRLVGCSLTQMYILKFMVSGFDPFDLASLPTYSFMFVCWPESFTEIMLAIAKQIIIASASSPIISYTRLDRLC